MKPEAVRFIRAELIPFMLREQGHGFAMSEWIAAIDPGVPFTADGVERNVHRCGVVACIGGSIEYLLRQRGAEQKAEVVVALLEDVIATDAACLENDEGWSDD